MKLITRVAVIFFILICYNYTPAQKKVIDVWNGKIPGSIVDTAYIEDTLRLEDGKARIRKVVNPTLTIYAPIKEKVNGTAILICPGGGYTRLAVDNEGEGLVKWLNDAGITAAILKYRLPSDLIMEDKSVGPLQDAQEAVRILRRDAKEFQLNPDKIGVIGFSAGGHLASTLATHFDAKVYASDKTSARPDFSILIYPVITMDPLFTHIGSEINLLGQNPDKNKIEYFSNELHVTKETPPTFIVHAQDDKTVPIKNSVEYYMALKKNNVPAELHIYQVGGHGFGLAKGLKTTAAQWPGACLLWLKEIGMCK